MRAFVGADNALHTNVTLGTGPDTDTLTGVETLAFAGIDVAFTGSSLNRTDNFAGDRFDDVLFQNAATGQLIFADMDAGAFTAFNTATSGLGNFTVGGSGDVNADGAADIFVQDAGSGTIFVA